MRCKVGDLAVVIRSKTNPEDVGMLVDVVAYIPPGVQFNDPEGNRYLPEGTPAWCVASRGRKFYISTGRLSSWSVFAEHCLRPIRPGSLDEETTESRELEAA